MKNKLELLSYGCLILLFLGAIVIYRQGLKKTDSLVEVPKVDISSDEEIYVYEEDDTLDSEQQRIIDEYMNSGSIDNINDEEEIFDEVDYLDYVIIVYNSFDGLGNSIKITYNCDCDCNRYYYNGKEVTYLELSEITRR